MLASTSDDVMGAAVFMILHRFTILLQDTWPNHVKNMYRISDVKEIYGPADERHGTGRGEGEGRKYSTMPIGRRTRHERASTEKATKRRKFTYDF